jgi:hypothetical protein
VQEHPGELPAEHLDLGPARQPPGGELVPVDSQLPSGEVVEQQRFGERGAIGPGAANPILTDLQTDVVRHWTLRFPLAVAAGHTAA